MTALRLAGRGSVVGRSVIEHSAPAPATLCAPNSRSALASAGPVSVAPRGLSLWPRLRFPLHGRVSPDRRRPAVAFMPSTGAQHPGGSGGAQAADPWARTIATGLRLSERCVRRAWRRAFAPSQIHRALSDRRDFRRDLTLLVATCGGRSRRAPPREADMRLPNSSTPRRPASTMVIFSWTSSAASAPVCPASSNGLTWRSVGAAGVGELL